jgi:hypothetical protein
MKVESRSAFVIHVEINERRNGMLLPNAKVELLERVSIRRALFCFAGKLAKPVNVGIAMLQARVHRAAPDQQVEMLKSILGRYVDSLIDGFPNITEDEVRKNTANYHQAIKNRIAEIAMGERMGSA